MIPKVAVQNQAGHDVVWVVQSGRVERRAITVGDTKAENVVVVAGLSAGERVVADGAQKLSEGSRVKESKR
jgi:hypothetical protein